MRTVFVLDALILNYLMLLVSFSIIYYASTFLTLFHIYMSARAKLASALTFWGGAGYEYSYIRVLPD